MRGWLLTEEFGDEALLRGVIARAVAPFGLAEGGFIGRRVVVGWPWNAHLEATLTRRQGDKMANDVHNGARRVLWCLAMLASAFFSVVAIASIFVDGPSSELLYACSIPLGLNLLAHSFSRWSDTSPQATEGLVSETDSRATETDMPGEQGNSSGALRFA